MLGANGTGFLDFNKSKYEWAGKIYKNMSALTWFPSQVDTSEESKDVSLLSDNELAIYKLTFAQLSFNDSIQTNYILDFRAQTTNSVVKAVLARQAWEEANHNDSYSVLLDAAGNSDEVFNLYKTDDMLDRKNRRISEQFARNIDGGSVDKLLLSAMASVNLEGIYFLLGFGYIYTLGDKVPGARDMIKEIAADELQTHLPLFSNIFKTIKRENKILTSTVDTCISMLEEAVDIELEYGNYLIERYPILGLTKDMMEDTIHNYANQRLTALGLPHIYDTKDVTHIQKLVTKFNKLNDTKTNFFEGNVSNYSKGSIDMNNF